MLSHKNFFNATKTCEYYEAVKPVSHLHAFENRKPRKFWKTARFCKYTECMLSISFFGLKKSGAMAGGSRRNMI